MSITRETIGDIGGGEGSGDNQEWFPSDTDPDHGGPDTLNPLLTSDGASAISPEWPEPAGFSPSGAGAVAASDGGSNRHARVVHERGARVGRPVPRPSRVTLTFASAYGSDVELLRRAFVVTRNGAGRTRWRHPVYDEAGDVASAPWIRLLPGSLKIDRSATAGIDGKVSVEIEWIT